MRTRFTMDDEDSSKFSGYLEGLSTEVSSQRYINSAMDFTFRTLAERFGIAMDSYAALHKNLFHHVYEWGDDYESRYSNVGNPASRLWQVESVGTRGIRTIGFVFRPSVKPSPVHPALLEEGKSGRAVKEGVHVFTWKAPVMEYGQTVTIRPQLSEYLAFYDGGPKFRRSSWTATPGKHVAGMFSAFFLKWWQGSGAAEAFDTSVRPELERDLRGDRWLDNVIGRRGRKRLNVRVNNRAAFEEGRRAAEAKMRANSTKYISQAAGRRYDRYGD